MARIRTIKPEFPQSESMGRVSRDARLLFAMLWTHCDDEGRARAASRMLASLLFPYDDDAGDLIEVWLGELEREGCIIRYEVDGKSYLQVCNWLEHQKIDRPSKSKFPAPIEPSRIIASPREPSCSDQGREGIKEWSVARARGFANPMMTEGWEPGADDIAWLAKARPDITEAVRRLETDKFRDHHIARANTSTAWGRDWRNWMRRTPAVDPPKPASDGLMPDVNSEGQWRARLKSYKPKGFWSPHWGPRPEDPHTNVPAIVLAEWRERAGVAA